MSSGACPHELPKLMQLCAIEGARSFFLSHHESIAIYLINTHEFEAYSISVQSIFRYFAYSDENICDTASKCQYDFFKSQPDITVKITLVL